MKTTRTAILCLCAALVFVTSGFPSAMAQKLHSTDVVETYRVGANPQGLAFDGTNIWVTSAGSNKLYELAQDGSLLGTVGMGANSYFAAFDGTNLWVTFRGLKHGLTKVRASDGEIVGRFQPRAAALVRPF